MGEIADDTEAAEILAEGEGSMTAKELHDRLETLGGWWELPANARALLGDFDAALGDAAAALFAAQQALLTEGMARNAAEERAEKVSNQLRDMTKDRDFLAALLAEREKGAGELFDRLSDCRAELADYVMADEYRHLPKDPARLMPPHVHEAIAHIEARRAEEPAALPTTRVGDEPWHDPEVCKCHECSLAREARRAEEVEK